MFQLKVVLRMKTPLSKCLHYAIPLVLLHARDKASKMYASTFDYVQRSSYIPISVLRKECVVTSAPTSGNRFKNAETCRPRSDLGRDFFCRAEFRRFSRAGSRCYF